LTPTYQFNVLKNPTGLALLPDAQGIPHLYISDSGNQVIRHFQPGGKLTIAAGSGIEGCQWLKLKRAI